MSLPARHIDASKVPVRRILTKCEFKESGCWEWQGYCFNNGYGSITVTALHKHAWPVHRLLYAYFAGESPDPWMTLDHLCRNRACVNPLHLELVTPGENIRRGHTGIKNYSKTHCVNGHEYTPENTLVRKEGWRNCRTCRDAGLERLKERRR